MAKRMRTKLREIKEQLMATRHDGIDKQDKWLAQVLRGWMAYYAVPMSGSAISAFRHHMIERWHGALMRRSQRRRLTWIRMKTIGRVPRCVAGLTISSVLLAIARRGLLSSRFCSRAL
jgi:hypothetical protein